MVQDSSS